MDGIANVARQQQSQVGASETQGRVHEQSQQVQQTHEMRMKKNDVVEQMQNEAKDNSTKKVDSQKKVEDLVKKLNDALAPITTDLKFGVDSQDVFYVSVIDTRTDRMIRRFPAEKGQEFLP